MKRGKVFGVLAGQERVSEVLLPGEVNVGKRAGRHTKAGAGNLFS